MDDGFLVIALDDVTRLANGSEPPGTDSGTDSGTENHMKKDGH